MYDPDRLKRVHVTNVSVKGDGDKLKAVIHLADENGDSAGSISWEQWAESGGWEEARRRIQ
jgi:hypothetical protein